MMMAVVIGEEVVHSYCSVVTIEGTVLYVTYR